MSEDHYAALKQHLTVIDVKQEHILDRLSEQSEYLKGMHREQIKLLQRVAKLEIKSGFWGALGGFIAGGAPFLYLILKGA